MEVGGDREALGLGLREGRRAGLRQQAPHGAVRVGVRREREAAGDLPQDHSEPALREVLADFGQRLCQLGGLAFECLRKVVFADGLRRAEEQRREAARKEAHEEVAVMISISPKVSR